MELVDIGPLTRRLREFADERDWQRVHTPKNLAMAVAGEVGELVAELQWLSDDQIAVMLGDDGAGREAFASELADVMIYLARLADVSGIDLDRALATKLAQNALRFRPNH